MGIEKKFPVDKEYAAAKRREMDQQLGKVEVAAGFNVIKTLLKRDEKQMLRSVDILPDTMDLPRAIEGWNEEVLGNALFVRNQNDETQLKLVGYILPSNNDFVIFFNNGQIHKGEVTEETEMECFTSPEAWHIERDESTFNGNSALTPEETKVFLDSFAEEGKLRITLSQNRIRNFAELVELKEAVDTSFRQVEETRAERDLELDAVSDVFVRIMEEIIDKDPPAEK